MDYRNQPLTFRVRKALRYVSLYGPRRTLAKVRSQYHMGRRYRSLPPERRADGSRKHVGLVGCGKFAYAQIAYYLRKNYGSVMRASMDVEIERAASLFEAYDLDYYTDDAGRLLGDSQIDLVFIASNHASHAEYAIEALGNGKHVHIEKPHVVSLDQLERLCAAMADSPARVSLGFNRPNSSLGVEIKRALESQTGPMMLNWFVAGHEIEPEHWYFQPQEGGRVLGNLCHWIDFVYQLVPPEARYPIEIRPARAERSDCDIAVSYVFGDGTIAAITFSAKGHTFEGVKERFAAHRGDVLVAMDDFKQLRIDAAERRRSIRLRTRDHGHEAAIRRSYAMTGRSGGPPVGATIEYVWETGELSLRTRQALEEDRILVVEPFGATAPKAGTR